MKPASVRSLRRALPVAAFFGAASYLQAIDTAGTLLVDLKATDFTTGSPTWANSGSLGLFNASGTPRLETINGATAVVFDGQGDYFSSIVTAPPSLEGPNATSSVEVWAWQGNARGEESLVSWGRRGGPDGSNASFGYGNNGAWGAVGHWGGADLGWDPNTTSTADGTAVIPPVGQWHHLVYTYNGTTTSVFANGVLLNSEVASIDTHLNQFMRIGNQNEADGLASGGQWFSGAIGQVRVHSEALTPAQITNNYNLEVGNYSGSAPVAAGLATGPIHRYSFNNTAGAAGDGTVVIDSVGGADGVVRGVGATATGSQIDLPGGSPDTQAYIDLPNGLISAHTAITLELWATVDTNQNWSRLIDAGTNSSGEIAGPGGSFSGTNYLMLSANTGGDPNQRFERNGVPILNGGAARDSYGNELGFERYYTITYDPQNQEWRHYEQGLLVDSIPTLSGPDEVPDVNFWLGRSNWSGDANLDGKFNEFRIYDRALTQDEINLNFIDGPDVLRIIPEPATTSTLALASCLVLLRRRRTS